MSKYNDWTKEGLINELRKRNYQYGELSNKYASLKYELENQKQNVPEGVSNSDTLGNTQTASSDNQQPSELNQHIGEGGCTCTCRTSVKHGLDRCGSQSKNPSVEEPQDCSSVDTRTAKEVPVLSTLPADLNSYKCGHKTNGTIIMDDNELSMCAYIQWAEEEKNLETKKECFDCYLKKLDGKDSKN